MGFAVVVCVAVLTGGGNPSGSDAGLEGYYALYRSKEACHVSTVLDGFLEGDLRGIHPAADLLENLQRYRDYLSEGFVVLFVHPSPMGGITMGLLPCRIPDRVFRVWVYPLGGDDYELREFASDPEFSREEAMSLAKRYREFLLDPEHRI